MNRLLDPWPAISDLFAGLVIATFGALILFTYVAGRPDPVDVKAKEIQADVEHSLQQALGGVSRPCGEDVCLDVTIEFELNKDGILPAFRERLARACSALHSTLRDPARRDLIEIFVEGHTDKTQPQGAATNREAYLYNWRLSASRASSVLYEFRACGVQAPEYRIVAVGHAETEPLCFDSTPDCLQKNRRTTFRLRPDRIKIANLLKTSQSAPPSE
jgi:outer membrane protein OmpA-like peptidoglycan-associated protein